MICADCGKTFDPVTSRQLFCDAECRNRYHAKRRTVAVQRFDKNTIRLYIYEIKCGTNGRVYIGFTNDVRRRWNDHLSSLQTNRHENSKLQTDFNEFGADDFDFSILFDEEIHAVTWNDLKKIDFRNRLKNSYHDIRVDGAGLKVELKHDLFKGE